MCQFHHKPEGTVGPSEAICECVLESEVMHIRVCVCVRMCVQPYQIPKVHMSACDVVTSIYCFRDHVGKERKVLREGGAGRQMDTSSK